MKYLEDTLAEQCLTKTLYPDTKIYVRRKKVEGRLMTYTNELEVEVDFSDVDPSIIKKAEKEKLTQSFPVLVNSNSDSEKRDLVENKSKPDVSKFFRKKT